MELLIGLVGLGFLVLIGLSIKFTLEDNKREKVIEGAKEKKISDLAEETSRKDAELKKMMDERQKLEDEFFKAKDEADIFKKDNSELTHKVKQLEKAKDESSELKAQIKQKELLLQQETVSRQKLQGELSLITGESEKLTKELNKLKEELKSKTDMYEGLKGQFDELESEFQKSREATLNKKDTAQKIDDVKVAPPEAPKEEKVQEPKEFKKPLDEKKENNDPVVIKPQQENKVSPIPEAPKDPPAPIVIKEDKPPEAKPIIEKPKEVSGPVDKDQKNAPMKETKPQQQDKPQAVEKKDEDIPGFPKPAEVKVQIKKGVPSDTDFLKAQTLPIKPEEKSPGGISEGAFKFNKAIDKDSQTKPDALDPQKKPQAHQEKDKSKSKRETLIPGFQPHDKDSEQS